MVDLDKIRGVVAPILAGLDLHLYDVELTGAGRARILRVTIERDGGVGIDEITDATRALDQAVDALIEGPFQLEVSSPGLERALRRPEHFATALGKRISVKYRDADGASHRTRAELRSFTDTDITVVADDDTQLVIRHDAITAAHMVFEWGPAPRPGKGTRPQSAQRTKETTRS